jgi:hypothetical protein
MGAAWVTMRMKISTMGHHPMHQLSSLIKTCLSFEEERVVRHTGFDLDDPETSPAGRKSDARLGGC